MASIQEVVDNVKMTELIRLSDSQFFSPEEFVKYATKKGVKEVDDTEVSFFDRRTSEIRLFNPILVNRFEGSGAFAASMAMIRQSQFNLPESLVVTDPVRRGRFYRDDTDTTTTDDGAMTLVAQSGKRYKRQTDFIRPEFFGAKADGVTDSTAAIQAAFDYGAKSVLFGKGTYLGRDIDTKNSNVIGVSNATTRLKCNGGKGFFKLSWDAPHWRMKTIQDLAFDGNDRQYDGVTYTGSGQVDELAGRYYFDRVVFQRCNKAIHKPHGNIGNYYNMCYFEENNYDYFAYGDEVLFMHAGFDTFYYPTFIGGKKANIYINSITGGTGGTRLIRPHFEGNYGFNIFIKNYHTAYTPFYVDNMWPEEVHPDTLINIEGTDYMRRGVYIENCPNFKIENSAIQSGYFINSNGIIDNSYMGSGLVSSDDNCNILVRDLSSDGYRSPLHVKSLLRNIRELSGYGGVMKCDHRRALAVNKQALYSESFSAGAVTIGGSGPGALGVLTAGGPTFANCNRFTFSSGLIYITPTVDLVEGKFYVLTATIRQISDIVPAAMQWTYGITATSPLLDRLIKNRFVTLGSVGKATQSGSVALYISTAGLAGNVVMDFQAIQVVQFDTNQEAINFFNEGLF